jgi:hypothetical protein
MWNWVFQSLELREELRLMVFEKKVLRRIVGQKMDVIRRELRKLHCEELYTLHSLTCIIRMVKWKKMKWASRTWGKKNAYRILVEKSEGNRPVRRPCCRLVDNIKMDSRLGWGGMDWNDLAQDRDQLRALVNILINLLVPYNNGKFLNCWATDTFLGRSQANG